MGSLSEYNKLESGGFRYNFVRGSLKNFVEQYLEALRGEMVKNRVKVTFWCREDCPVLMDENELKRVLDNLMTNTVRYRVKDTSSVEIRLRKLEQERWRNCLFR